MARKPTAEQSKTRQPQLKRPQTGQPKTGRAASDPLPAPRRSRPGGDWPISTCDCRLCRQACLNSPGWFLPDQLPALAEYLELSLEEVFRKYLGLGATRLASQALGRGVMPHKLQDRKKPGSRWTLAEIARPGRCIFYDRGKCAIYRVRPFECSRALHSRADRAVALRRHVAGKWSARDLKPYLAWSR